MNNFQNKWNKLTPDDQEKIKNKTQEVINNWYDPNKIKNHIEQNSWNSNIWMNQTSVSWTPAIEATPPTVINLPKFETII